MNLQKAVPVTLWSRHKTKTGLFEHNHLEDGHSESNAPNPISEQQKASWGNGKWEKRHGWMYPGGMVVCPPALTKESLARI
jgi:hypothetical protein